MKLSQFRFDLPLNLIAQHPAKKREDSRLMVVHRHTGQMEKSEIIKANAEKIRAALAE